MTVSEWNHDFARCLGVYLSGETLEERDSRGRPIVDDNFLLLFNAHHDEIQFVLPEIKPGCMWETVLDTHFESGLATDGNFTGNTRYPIQGRSLVMLRQLCA